MMELMNRIIDNDMLDFDTDHPHIRYIPQDSVDEVIELVTPEVFTVIRRCFLLESSDLSIDLEIPVFEIPEFNGMTIYETGVNRI